MIFIGGLAQKNIELRPLESLMCKHCRQTHRMAVFKNYDCFHLFFIPLWKWNLNYHVKCLGCQTLMTIPVAKGTRWEQGEPIELTLWDLDIVIEGDMSQTKCSYCQEAVSRAYQFCPHCGEPLS